jgi:hypothetical protein
MEAMKKVDKAYLEGSIKHWTRTQELDRKQLYEIKARINFVSEHIEVLKKRLAEAENETV